MGWSVTVGNSNPLMRFLGTVAGQILGQRMRTFDTPEEAMAFLWEIDPNLTPDAADE
jgi:hypothetical protein